MIEYHIHPPHTERNNSPLYLIEARKKGWLLTKVRFNTKGECLTWQKTHQQDVLNNQTLTTTISPPHPTKDFNDWIQHIFKLLN